MLSAKRPPSWLSAISTDLARSLDLFVFLAPPLPPFTGPPLSFDIVFGPLLSQPLVKPSLLYQSSLHPDSEAMVQQRQLSLLALGLAAAAPAVLSQQQHKAGSFEDGGDTLVSAMMVRHICFPCLPNR